MEHLAVFIAWFSSYGHSLRKVILCISYTISHYFPLTWLYQTEAQNVSFPADEAYIDWVRHFKYLGWWMKLTTNFLRELTKAIQREFTFRWDILGSSSIIGITILIRIMGLSQSTSKSCLLSDSRKILRLFVRLKWGISQNLHDTSKNGVRWITCWYTPARFIHKERSSNNITWGCGEN